MINLLTELDPLSVSLFAVLATLTGIIINSLLTWIAFRRADKAETRAVSNAAISELLSLSSRLFHHMERMTVDLSSIASNSENWATYQVLYADAKALVETIGEPFLIEAFDAFNASHSELLELTKIENNQTDPDKIIKSRMVKYIIFKNQCHLIVLKNFPLKFKSLYDE